MDVNLHKSNPASSELNGADWANKLDKEEKDKSESLFQRPMLHPSHGA